MEKVDGLEGGQMEEKVDGWIDGGGWMDGEGGWRSSLAGLEKASR